MATKPDNKVVFHSDQFGTVILVKRGCVERSWYWKGQLTHRWCGWFHDKQGLKWFHYRKGQVVWLSKSFFQKVNVEREK